MHTDAHQPRSCALIRLENLDSWAYFAVNPLPHWVFIASLTWRTSKARSGSCFALAEWALQGKAHYCVCGMCMAHVRAPVFKAIPTRPITRNCRSLETRIADAAFVRSRVESGIPPGPCPLCL